MSAAAPHKYTLKIRMGGREIFYAGNYATLEKAEQYFERAEKRLKQMVGDDYAIEIVTIYKFQLRALIPNPRG